MDDDEWYHELRARYKMAMSMKAQKERDNYTRKQFDNPESKCYNPDVKIDRKKQCSYHLHRWSRS